MKIFFARMCFKSSYGYFLKIDLKKHRDTKVTFCYSCIDILYRCKLYQWNKNERMYYEI